MARIVPAKCPNCGAALRLDLTRDVATCTYCGTTSLIQRDRTVPRAPEGHVIYVPDGQRRGLVPGRAIAFMLAGVMFAAGITAALIAYRKTPRTPRPGPGPSPTSIPSPPDVVEHLTLLGRRPLLVDLNGDGASDLVAAVSVYRGRSLYSFRAFDGKSGAELWTTDDLGSEIHQAVLGLGPRQLLLGLSNGEVRGYQLSGGKQSIGLKLGEKVAEFCGAPSTGAVRARLADGSSLEIDLASGEQQPARDPGACRPLPSDVKTKSDVGKKLFPDEDLPRELESYRCGSITVRGTYNYFFPDQCPKKLGLGENALGELEPGSIVRRGKSWVILGYKQPGSRVPMLGLASGGKIVWSAVVPAKDPLTVTSGKPKDVAVGLRRVVVGYAPTSGGTPRVAAFDLATGRRLWDESFPLSSTNELVASEDGVTVLGSNGLTVLDAESGRERFTIGGS